MGFDWDLHVNLYVDRISGLPYVFSMKHLKQLPFNPEEWRLPERFREFAQMRGHHLMFYVREIDLEGAGSTSASPFGLLHHFPSWNDIKDSTCWKEYEWDEVKHNTFKECLQWCEEKGGFSASWSY